MERNAPLLLALLSSDVRPPRKRLLLINNSGWAYRSAINALVGDKFNPPLKNLYCGEYPHSPCAGDRSSRGKAVDLNKGQKLASQPPDLEALLDFNLYGQCRLLRSTKAAAAPPRVGCPRRGPDAARTRPRRGPDAAPPLQP